jgi:hypothetical protein
MLFQNSFGICSGRVKSSKKEVPDVRFEGVCGLDGHGQAPMEWFMASLKANIWYFQAYLQLFLNSYVLFYDAIKCCSTSSAKSMASISPSSPATFIASSILTRQKGQAVTITSAPASLAISTLTTPIRMSSSGS